MKKLLMVLVMLLMMALVATVDGITWTYVISNSTANVGNGWSQAIPSETKGAITTPSSFGGYSAASIGNSTFYNCSGLTIVTNVVAKVKASPFRGRCIVETTSPLMQMG